MASGSLPVHFHNYNTGITAGTSEFKLICSAIYAESAIDYTYWRSSVDAGNTRAVTTNTPIISLKPSLTYNGVTNRVGIYPDCISVFVSGGPVKVQIVDDAVLSGATWNIDNGTTLGDSTASSSTGGEVFHTYYFDAGSHHIDVNKLFETNDEGYHVLADGTDAYTMSLVFTKLNGGDTVTATATINYRELR
jgi:hypothetical protein